MRRTHQGSCHCGEVRFEAELDLSTETSRCNCSICTKARFWKSVIPEADFRLLQGQDRLTDYQFGAGRIHHMFCRRCGVKTFGRGEAPGIGRFVAVNVAALDSASDAEWAGAPMVFQDGRHDDYEHAPAVTSYL